MKIIVKLGDSNSNSPSIRSHRMVHSNSRPSTPNPSSLQSLKTIPLLKQQSWSSDIERDEAWIGRRTLYCNQKDRLSRSVTNEDLDELKGCIDLGFRFEINSPAARRLSETFPALDLYFAVHEQYGDSSRSSSAADESSLDESLASSQLSIESPGNSPKLVKTRLKQRAQAVACSMRQHY